MSARVRSALLLLAVLAFALLARFAPLGETSDAAPEGLIDSGVSLGVLLVGAWLTGRLFSTFGLPKITGYIALGVLVGPSVLAIVGKEQIPHLRLVNDLAIAVIALTAGGEIKLDFLKRNARSLLLLSLGHALVVGVVVGVFLFFFQGPLGVAQVEGVGAKIAIAAVVAAIATSGSPAVVVAVISEAKAHNRFSQTALASVVCLDLVVIILFALAMALAAGPLGPYLEGAAPDRPALWLYLLHHIGGSMLAGGVIGLLLAWYTHAVRAHMAIFVVFSCLAIALLSEQLGLEPLIVALVAGMLMQNAWPESSESLFETVEELSLPVYAAFFSLAAVKIDLELLATLWVAALGLVALRGISVYAGVTTAARFTALTPREGRWIWTGFFSQAGVTLALAAVVQRTFDGAPFANTLYNVILAMIAIEELIGPVLFRLGLRRGGAEESLADAPLDEPVLESAPTSPRARD